MAYTCAKLRFFLSLSPGLSIGLMMEVYTLNEFGKQIYILTLLIIPFC